MLPPDDGSENPSNTQLRQDSSDAALATSLESTPSSFHFKGILGHSLYIRTVAKVPSLLSIHAHHLSHRSVQVTLHCTPFLLRLVTSHKACLYLFVLSPQKLVHSLSQPLPTDVLHMSEPLYHCHWQFGDSQHFLRLNTDMHQK